MTHHAFASVALIALTSLSLPVFADYAHVKGDTPCPEGYALVTPEEARSGDACRQLGKWDIARLSGAASMEGSGNGCFIHSHDSRKLGNTLCKVAQSFEVVEGDDDRLCPDETQVASYEVAKAWSELACSTLGRWDIARLADSGSMDGRGYECKIRHDDERELGDTLCVDLAFENVDGDVPCPAGYRYLTADEARRDGSQLCNTLGEWDIVRLEGGASMDGPGYGCKVRDFDARRLGDSLCIDIKRIQ